MRLGVIDIGSNTVHLLVVDAYAGGHPLPAFSHKIELRLSESLTVDGRVDAATSDKLVAFIHECLGIADDHGVQDLFAFATSALREAPNGQSVIDRVRAETGVELETLSGDDEARMTFLAVRRWFGWSSGRLLVVDIGGGSLELASGIDEEPDVAMSLPLGAGRVTRERLPGDPPTPERVRAVRTQVRGALAERVRPLLKAGVADRAVGTSKTMRSLARIAGAAPRADGPFVPRSLSRADLGAIVERLKPMDAVSRAQLPGVSPGRAQQLLAGALVAEAALDLLQLDRLEICPWALREGLILRHLDHLDHVTGAADPSAATDPTPARGAADTTGPTGAGADGSGPDVADGDAPDVADGGPAELAGRVTRLSPALPLPHHRDAPHHRVAGDDSHRNDVGA